MISLKLFDKFSKLLTSQFSTVTKIIIDQTLGIVKRVVEVVSFCVILYVIGFVNFQFNSGIRLFVTPFFDFDLRTHFGFCTQHTSFQI